MSSVLSGIVTGIGFTFIFVGSLFGGQIPANSSETEVGADVVQNIENQMPTVTSSPKAKETVQNQLSADPIVSAAPALPEIKIAVDLCPNLDGIQESVPTGLARSKERNVCLTGEELDELSDAEKSQELESAQCENSEDALIEISKEYEAALADYYATRTKIEKNEQGMFGTGLAQLLIVERDKWQIYETEYLARKNTIHTEIYKYCK